MRAVRFACVGLLTTFFACGGSDPAGSTELECGVGASAILSATEPVVVSGDEALDLAGAAVAADMATTIPAAEVAISCGDDIAPDGFVALGPAVTIGPAGAWSDRPFTITLPFKAARLPEAASRRHVRIAALRHVGDGTAYFPPVSLVSVDDEDAFNSSITFRTGELITFQVVASETAGQPVMRRFTYRAIAGISMGGNASMSIGIRNHELFDYIVDLGGEPGPSMKYSMNYFADFLYGGFCTAEHQADGIGNIGELCTGERRALYSDQFERGASYEEMLYEAGDGVGLRLNRNLYLKASRDLSRALGNPVLYRPDNPYLPPGVPLSIMDTEAAERCANPTVLTSFYDREFNPEGTTPVITFCDGGDSPTLGLGVFDPELPQQNPFEIMLAVDVNGNGVRDRGEPVIVNLYEPFEDVGVDGVADQDETGLLGAYDATTNPDPAGDNYHYLRNPKGTEKNLHREEGEPYEDVGLDGVAGTCQIGAAPGCYDTGEGDGEWTLSPNLANWYQSDLSVVYEQLTEPERDRLNFWIDAGIRDFLNAAVSANAGIGELMGKYAVPSSLVDEFAPLTGAETERQFDFLQVDWDAFAGNVFLRYGNPDATEEQILNGDGRHVGTALQVINRVTTSIAWLEHHWPNGDREPLTAGGEIIDDLSFMTSNGRETPFAIFLPPGYDLPENADKRYPVIYLLHGYGQEPEDMVLISAVYENYMTNPSVEPEERFQKFIIVYPDGRCRPDREGVPVLPDGDLCERGTFYLDAVLGGPAQMESNLLELIGHIDTTYRTKLAEDVEYIP